jgi:hypothetical protein
MCHRRTSRHPGSFQGIEPDDLPDAERVFIAGKLREALLVEEVLTAAGVNYAVQVEPFGTSILFSQRNGAAFYLTSGQADYCRTRLIASGLGRGVVEDPAGPDGRS